MILTETGVVRTKHIRAIENEFPGLSTTEQEEETDSGDHHVEINLSDSETPEVQSEQSHSDSDGSDDDPEGYNMSPHEELTNVPAKSSRYGESNDNNDNEDAHDDQNSDDDYQHGEISTDTVETHSRRPGLRPLKKVRYTHRAVPTAVSTGDEPTLREALKSPERWL